MKRQKRGKATTISVGSEPTLSSVAIRRGSDRNVTRVPAARRMRYVALIVLLLMGVAFVGPQALYSQAAVLSPAGVQTTVLSGVKQPSGVAVDGAGDLFIADSGNNRVVEVAAFGGTITTVATGLNQSFGLAG